MGSRHVLRMYVGAVPRLLAMQAVSKSVLALAAGPAGAAARALLHATGNTVLLTSNALPLLATWQGWVLLALGVLVLGLYLALDINAVVLTCFDYLTGRRFSPLSVAWRAVSALPRLASAAGVAMTAICLLAVPLAGVGAGSALTSGLRLPGFVESYVLESPPLTVCYVAILLALAVLAVMYAFSFHGVLVDGASPSKAMRDSRALVSAHPKDYLPRMALFSLVLSVVIAAAVVAATVLLVAGADAASRADGISRNLSRFLIVACVLLLTLVVLVLAVLFGPLEVLQLTVIYLRYTGRVAPAAAAPAAPALPAAQGGRAAGPGGGERRPVRGRHVAALVLLATALGLTLVAARCVLVFDEMFPASSQVQVIAHRAGGYLAPENSLQGVHSAAVLGADGFEVDVQRTEDGRYVVNHDDDFKRLYGDGRRSSQMTLAEVRELKTPDGTGVATLEEMLAQARGRGTLYIELKGETADERMADDVARIVERAGMQRQVALISLNYEVVAYAEREHPELETGYLYFLSYGDVQDLSVDDLMMEEGVATPRAVAQAHAAGKRAVVWTVEDGDTIARLLSSDVDAIITDDVFTAVQMRSQMRDREDFTRVWDAAAGWILGMA